MKNLSDILRRSNITPLERVTALVHNDISRDKTGKDALSSSDLFVLTKAWTPRASEAREYNRYINIVKLQDTMKMDAQMFLYRSELALLRNQRVLDSFLSSTKSFKELAVQEFTKDISKEESTKLLTQSTYFEYQKLLHIFTFNKLPKETQSDLLLLDESVASDGKYLEDQVFLYEVFKDSEVLSQQNKDLIINRIYSCMYYAGMKKIRGDTSEKDGFFLHNFFAELPIIDVFLKLTNDAHILHDGTDENLLSVIEEYAKIHNTSIELLVKETLCRWLDGSLFLQEYLPLFMSEYFNTWNGNTKNNHTELFMTWYTELQKSKLYFQNLFDSGKLIKLNINRDFFGIPRNIEIITGISLYMYKEKVDFVEEYKKQIETLVPLANMFLFVKKHAEINKKYKTLCEFKNLSQKFSVIFDIDMTENYSYFIKSYKEEVELLNHSLSRLLDIATDSLYAEKSLNYIIEIVDNNFIFNTNLDEGVDKVIESYTTEFKKIE